MTSNISSSSVGLGEQLGQKTQSLVRREMGTRLFRWILPMDSEKLIYRLSLLVVLVGLVYYVYSYYYGSAHDLPSSWNFRQAKSIERLYAKDPILSAVHDRMVKEKDSLSSEVTIVTAYFNLGKLNKGGMFGGYTPSRYKNWMKVFGRITNPLIVFTDSQDTASFFKEVRSQHGPNRTKIIQISRSELWAFSLAPEIRKIYDSPGYPEYDPNTVNENYSCVMHAKFELVHKVITDKLFNTKFIAWVDIGMYRAIVDQHHSFPIRLPPGFDPTKVAYSGQHQFDSSLSPYQIISEDKTWVGGAMFLGTPEVVYVYTEDYMLAVKKLISDNLMSTDQQVIYIMYQPSFKFNPRVELQIFTTHSTDDWFYLGYAIKETWDAMLRESVSLAKFFSFLL